MLPAWTNGDRMKKKTRNKYLKELIAFWYEANEAVFNNCLEFEGVSIANYKEVYGRYHADYGIRISLNAHKYKKNLKGSLLHEMCHQYVEQFYYQKDIKKEEKNGWHGELFLQAAIMCSWAYPQHSVI